TNYGKTVLAACFITDLGTVVALGMIFAPFTYKTLVFVAVGIFIFVVLPWLTPRFFKIYGNRPSELEAKYLLFALFGMGGLGGQRGRPARLSHRDGAGGHDGQGPRIDPPTAHPRLRIADALLLHPRGLLRLHPRAHCRARRLHSLADRKDRQQVRRRL